MIHILSEQTSILNQYIAEIRDKHIQQDRIRFRRNMERIGEFFAYEISKTFTYNKTVTETVLVNEHAPLVANVYT